MSSGDPPVSASCPPVLRTCTSIPGSLYGCWRSDATLYTLSHPVIPQTYILTLTQERAPCVTGGCLYPHASSSVHAAAGARILPSPWPDRILPHRRLYCSSSMLACSWCQGTHFSLCAGCNVLSENSLWTDSHGQPNADIQSKHDRKSPVV